jgi:hypothetical protein
VYHERGDYDRSKRRVRDRGGRCRDFQTPEETQAAAKQIETEEKMNRDL